MQKLNATYQDGKWYWNGNPVVLKFIIRTEDKRKEIGDYVASQLEKLGFTVDRMYMTSRQASPIWLLGDPADGQWHLYTGAWITTAVSRDESDNFDWFYTNRGGWGTPLWQSYKPDPTFDEISRKLAYKQFSTMEERDQMMEQALWYTMKFAVRIFLDHRTSPYPARKEVALTYDLAGGFPGAWTWAHTIRYVDKVGGSMKIASGALLIDPWNPVGGSNWIYDAMIYRATALPAVYPDPLTGLGLPNLVKKAHVYVKSGLPVIKTLDWVDLTFTDNITVPDDAWISWNASLKKIMTVGEVLPPENRTAVSKVVVEYRDDLWDVKFHDGSPLTLADFIFDFILTFDRGDPASPVYDPSYVPSLEAFKQVFKGFKIIQEDPLIIEYYTDTWYMDAEWIAWDAAGAFDAYYGLGEAPWHMVAIGLLAEMDQLAAFTFDKADSLGVDVLNYIAGDTLNILVDKLDQAISEAYIPYEEVLGQYITTDEALARYNNLKQWYNQHGNLWVGAGPFYLDSVDPTAQIVVIKAYRDYIDTADRWVTTLEKAYGISIAGPTTKDLIATLPASIDVTFTYKDKPITPDDVQMVKYLLTSGGYTQTGDLQYIGEGVWRVVLSGENTLVIAGKPYSLTVYVVPKFAGIPSTFTITGTVIPYEDYISSQIAPIRAELKAALADLQESLSDLQSEVADIRESIPSLSPLQETVNSMQTMLWAALGLSVIAIIIALFAVVRKR